MSLSSITLNTEDRYIPELKEAPSVLQDEDKTRIRAAFIQMYWENGHLPSLEKVVERFNGQYTYSQVEETRNSEECEKALRANGILNDGSVGFLSPQQILVANMECNFLDKTPIRSHLEALGISTSTYSGWKRDPTYQAYIQKRMEAVAQSLETEAIKTIQKSVLAGSENTAWKILEMTGRYQKNLNINVNIEAIMAGVIQILIDEIDDKDKLESIATRISELGVNHAS